MRTAAILFTSLLIGACSNLENTEVKSCEEKLVRDLKSPSSYNRIEAGVWDEKVSADKLAASYFGENFLPYEKQLLDDIQGKAIAVRHVSIEYDADNSYGASLRDSHFCNFVVVSGSLYRPSPTYDAQWQAHIDDIIADKATATVKNTKFEAPLEVTDKRYDPLPSFGIELPPY